ncbi:uncharacterized protein LOC128394173 [Panonychus citri]|uniref:uncharacterized protein LOC128394173 n=1 Tax=Panonychus citri TaxID=50023 RepID=UPI0023081475|nr:uncharacterized protein LOC128394173 [Panonychus citri]
MIMVKVIQSITINFSCLIFTVLISSEPIYGLIKSPGDNLLTSSSSSSPSADWLLLPTIVKSKLTHANYLIVNGENGKTNYKQLDNNQRNETRGTINSLPILDPLDLKSMWLLTNHQSDFINATLHHVTISGLKSIKIKDISSNDLTQSLSILLQFTGLKITGHYQVTHQTNQPTRINNLDKQLIFGKSEMINNDSGSFEIQIANWYTSWFAHVINYNLTSSSLIVVNPWCKSYHDMETHSFNSNSTKYQCDSKCYQAFDSIASIILGRVTSEIDSHLMKLMNRLIEEETPINWIERYNLALNHHNKGEKQLITMDSNGNSVEESHSRSKRQVPCKAGKELDEYVDSLFRFAARIIRVMEPFSTPNATIYLPEYNIKIFLYEGSATRAYSLQRRKSAWVHCSNESVSLGLTLGFENLRVRYKYRAIHDWKLLWDGDFEADIQGSKTQVQFTQTTPKGEEDSQVQQRVDRLRIGKLGKIRLIIRGLGNLTQGVGLWLSQYLNDPYNQKALAPTIRRLEAEAVPMINVMLQNFTVPFFTII